MIYKIDIEILVENRTGLSSQTHQIETFLKLDNDLNKLDIEYQGTLTGMELSFKIMNIDENQANDIIKLIDKKFSNTIDPEIAKKIENKQIYNF